MLILFILATLKSLYSFLDLRFQMFSYTYFPLVVFSAKSVLITGVIYPFASIVCWILRFDPDYFNSPFILCISLFLSLFISKGAVSLRNIRDVTGSFIFKRYSSYAPRTHLPKSDANVHGATHSNDPGGNEPTIKSCALYRY